MWTAEESALLCNPALFAPAGVRVLPHYARRFRALGSKALASMLAIKILSATLVLASAGVLAAIAQDGDVGSPGGSLSFQEVHKVAENASDVLFTHVEALKPKLILRVYSKYGQLKEWHEGQDPGTPLSPGVKLGANEHFVFSPRRSLYAVVSIRYDCFAQGVLSGQAIETQLLPESFPSQLPDGPLPPFPGAGQGILSEDGSVIALASLGGHEDSPMNVAIFAPSGNVYERVGDYSLSTHGPLELSQGLPVIAQGVGTAVELRDRTGDLIGKVPAGRGFELALDGVWLAVPAKTGVDVYGVSHDSQQNPPWTVTAKPQLMTASPPLGVTLHGRFALVRERARLSIFDLDANQQSSQQPVWSVSTGQGYFTSADLRPMGQGRFLVAAGRLEVERAPTRSGGAPVSGEARAYVDLYKGNPTPSSTFVVNIDRWTREDPRVQLIGQPPHVLAESRGVVHISEVVD
jgi:hypothetical protein